MPKNKQYQFLKLYNPIKMDLEKFVLSLTLNRNDSKDIIGDTLLHTFTNFEKIKKKSSLKSYLFTTAYRLFTSQREKFRRNEYKEPIEFTELAGSTLSSDKKYDINILYVALEKIPELQKEAIILAEILGFKHKEIAEIQGTSLSNVKSRVYRAKKELENILKNDISIYKNDGTNVETK